MKKNRIIVAGGRDFQKYETLKKVLNEYIENHNEVEIISGRARGADSLGEKYALENNIPCKTFPAKWDLYGKSAGYKRNVEMANYATDCICFWDQKSKGTNHMINIAKEKGLKLTVIFY